MPSKSAARRQKTGHKGSASARQGTSQKVAVAPAKPQRGGWLTAAIVVIALHEIVNIILLVYLRRTEYTQAPAWLIASGLAVGLATIVAAVALWYWKRWGLYLYAIATLGSIALGLVVFRTQLAVFYNLVPLGILGWILTSQRKIDLFK